MTNNKMVANVEQNIIGGVNMERVFNEELASIIAEVVGHEMKMEEEVEMKKVSILDKFAAHHNRAEDVEVVVEEKKEEEVEMKSTIEEEVAKIVDELERQAKVKADNEEFDRMAKREEKKAMFRAKVSGFFGMAKGGASLVKDTVVDTADSKVKDFLFGSLEEGSSAPVEKEVKEVEATADEIFQSIEDRKDAFFAEHSIKPAFGGGKAFFAKKEDYAEQAEEIEEKISANDNRMVEIDEELEAMRAELEKEAALRAELEEINKMREEIRLEKELSVEDKLKQEIEELKAQIAFEVSKQEARDADVKESDVLNTKEDIDAYFMGQ